MCETRSWRTCIYAFGFALKSGCDRGWIRDGLGSIFCVFTLKDEVRVQVRGGLELPLAII
jgi:hypothetical protein